MSDPDVLVAGGGPSGSTAGGLLAEMGWSVLIVDRARFPRPKPCGECVNPGGVAALARLALLERIQALAPAHLSGWRLRGAGVEVTARFGGSVRGFGVSRTDLDAALLDAARSRGAEVLEETHVEQVAPATTDGRPTVILRGAKGTRRTVRPRLLVAADGLRSITSRALGLVARTPRLRKLSLTFHLRGDPPAGWHDGSGELQGTLDVRDGITLGVAPLAADGTRWNATVVADAGRHGRAVADDPVGFFHRVLDERTGEDPGRKGGRAPTVAGAGGASGFRRWRIEGGPWASGPFDWPTRRCWAPGVVLVGDAAGYFDPFTGQGIYRALRSAELAAKAVAEVLARPTPSWTALAAYDAAWRHETRAAVWVQRGVETVMAHAGLARPVLRRLHASGGLARVIRVTGDVAAPVSLLDPRVWL